MENTLFVSTLPYSATSKDLETFCSEVGPLRSCFVIQDKTDPSKNAGCGFVTFVLADDAAKAIPLLKKKKFMDLRFLKIQFARKADEPRQATTAVADKQNNVQVEKNNEFLLKSKRSLLISDLPSCITQKQLYKKVKKYGTVSAIKYSEGDDKAIVDYNSHEEASNAFKHLNDHVFKGTKIKAELTKKERYRLFLKNLHFQCTDKDIRKVAEEFGLIKDVSVPSKNENRGKGFAFLEYNTKEECEKAILGMKGKKIRGREISVDWAVSKKDWVGSESVKNGAETQDSSNDSSAITADVDSKTNEDEAADDDSENFDNDTQDIQNEDIKAGESAEYQPERKDPKNKANRFLEETTLFIRNLSYDVTQEDLEKCLVVFGKLRYARITMDPETGHSRGSGFVCFFAEEDAKACYNSYQEFINTSVVDEWKENQFSKKGGKEIVSSLTPEPAKALLNSPFFLSGRLLNISWALSRSDATQASKDGKAKRRAEDKRNMYLMTEGVIFPDSDAANGMSPSELSRRQKSYTERKRILTLNPNLFMSKTRLSIRNLNLKVDDKILQSSAQNAVNSFWQEVNEGKRESLDSDVMEEAAKAKYNPIGKKKVWVKQAKILRSKERIDPVSKLGRSKGYGFVEFLHHCDALACLRWMNNNPHAFTVPDTSEEGKEKGNRQRPIVEFAVENRLVLKRRSDRNRPENKSDDKKRKMGNDTNDQKGSKRFKGASKDNSGNGTSAKAFKGDINKKNGSKKNIQKKSESPKYLTKKSLKTETKSSETHTKQHQNKLLQPKKSASKVEKIANSPKQPINKVVQPKNAASKIGKKGQKSTKKMINVNISLEDIKKWNV